MNKVLIAKKEDREALAVILFRNGYKCWEEKIKETGKSKYNYYVCYERGNNGL